MHLWLSIGLLLTAPGEPARADPQNLARQIDRRLAERFEAENVSPAGLSDDAEFLRRLSLDLIGRIPTPAEIRGFLPMQPRKADTS